MGELGQLLRQSRERSVDGPHGKRLSLERMAELVGLQLEDEGFSFQTLSNWERGRHRIPERRRLMAAIQILCEHGGLTQPHEADQLLKLAQFSPLDDDECRRLFPGRPINEPVQSQPPPPNRPDRPWRLALYLLGELTYQPSPKLRQLIEPPAGGPPNWPGLFIGLASAAASRFTIRDVWRALQRIWVWVLAWFTLLPSLHWPFPDRAHAVGSLGLYVAGALVIPLLIGALTDTRHSPFWSQASGLRTGLLRLYTHQGAAIGFCLGYMGVFTAALVGHYFGLRQTAWLGALAAAIPLLTGYLGARAVPFNLWTAYARLELADGGVFFVFVAFSPLWAIFFLFAQDILLQPLTGSLIILTAISMLAALMIRQLARTSSTVIPAHIWIGVYGSVLVLYQLTVAKSIFDIVALASLIVILAALMARNQITATLAGMLLLLAGTVLILALTHYNVWIGRAATIILLLTWRLKSKHLVWFPAAFWLIVLTITGGTVILRHWPASDAYVSGVLALITAVIILNLALRQARLAPTKDNA